MHCRSSTAIAFTAPGDKKHLNSEAAGNAIDFAQGLDGGSFRVLHPRGPSGRLVGEIHLAQVRPIREQRLIEMIGFDAPELLGRGLLGTVAAKVEEGDITDFGLTQVATEGVNHTLPRRLGI